MRPEAAKSSSADATREDLRFLRKELLRLEDQLQELKRRLDLCEAESASAADPAPASAVGALNLVSQPASPELPALVATQSATSPGTPDDEGWDLSLGSGLTQAMDLAAVAALVLCVGFVVRLSLGGGAAPLVLTVLGCAGFLLLSKLFRGRGSLRLAVWLEGAAVGAGYLAAFAAFGLTGSLAVALLVATIVGIAGVAVSLARDSQAIAIFAVFGAVITPLLMRGGSGHPGEQAAALLFAYLALLNLSALAISRFRYWPWQAASSLLATHFLAWFWYAEHRHADPLLTLVFPCVTYAVFIFRPLLSASHPRSLLEKAMALANAGLFFAALQTLLFAYAPKLLPYSALALAAAQAAATWWIGRRRSLAGTHLAAAMLLAIPGAYVASPVLAPFVWVGLGAVLAWIGIRYDRVVARVFATVLLGGAIAAAPRLYVLIPSAAAGIWYLTRARQDFAKPGDVEWLARWVFTLGLLLSGPLVLITELRLLLARPEFTTVAGGAQLFYSLAIAVYSAALALWGRASRSLFFRTSAWLLFVALALKVFMLDLVASAGGWRVASLMLLAVSLLAINSGRRKTVGQEAKPAAR